MSNQINAFLAVRNILSSHPSIDSNERREVVSASIVSHFVRMDNDNAKRDAKFFADEQAKLRKEHDDNKLSVAKRVLDNPGMASLVMDSSRTGSKFATIKNIRYYFDLDLRTAMELYEQYYE